jgi:hypothetical protein
MLCYACAFVSISQEPRSPHFKGRARKYLTVAGSLIFARTLPISFSLSISNSNNARDEAGLNGRVSGGSDRAEELKS